MNETSDDEMIVEEILTMYSPQSTFSKLKTFQYYDPTTNEYGELPNEGEYYLVKWEDYSILESSWIEKSKLNGNKKIDPNNKFDEFLKDNRLGKLIIQPAINKILPANELMPEKILLEKKSDNNNVYNVKWNYDDEMFISTESPIFFESPERQLLLKRFEGITKKQISISSFNSIPKLLNIDDNTSLCIQNIFNSLKNGNVCWTSNSLKLKFALYNTINLMMKNGATGPFVILTSPNNVKFYKENINHLFPKVNITFLVDRPKELVFQKLRKQELYKPKAKALNNGILISTPDMFKIKRGLFVDILFCDMDPQIAFQSNFYCEEKMICVLYDKMFSSEALKSRIRRRKLGEIKHIEYSTNNFYIKYIDVFIHMKQEQKQMYFKLLGLLNKPRMNKELCIEAMKRVLTQPSLFKGNDDGCKIRFIIKLLNLIQSKTNFKIAILGDYDKSLRTIAEALKCNIIDWELNYPKTQAICSLMALDKIEVGSDEILKRYNKKSNGKNVELMLNNKIVCVDNSCDRMNIDLSMIDIVIDFSNDYSPLFESVIRTKYSMLLKKNVFVFELTIHNSIDEITAMMNELDQELDEKEETKIYCKSVLRKGFKYGYNGKLKQVTENHLINDLLVFKGENDTRQIVLDVDGDDICSIKKFNKKGFIEEVNPKPMEEERSGEGGVEEEISEVEEKKSKKKGRGRRKKEVKSEHSETSENLIEIKEIKEENQKMIIVNDVESETIINNGQKEIKENKTDVCEEKSDETIEQQIEVHKEEKNGTKSEEKSEFISRDDSVESFIQIKDLINGPQQFNKDRILSQFGKLDHEGNVLKERKEQKMISTVPSPYELKIKKSLEIPEIPVQRVTIVPMDESYTSEEEVNENELHQIIKKYVSGMSLHKVDEWLISIECTIKRFGSDVRNWKIDPTQFVPLTSQQLQMLVNELIKHPKCSKEVIQYDNIYKVLDNAIKIIHENQVLLPITPSKCPTWDLPCDLELLLCVEKYGLGVTELYLNNFVMDGVLTIGNYNTTEKKINFLNERIDLLVTEYMKKKIRPQHETKLN